MTHADVELRRLLQSALGESFTIERELTGGGMSRVFVAHEAGLDRKVVVKVLAPELAQELSAERFAREVRLTASLQHPNIVPVLQAGNAGALPYYVMPYVRGDSLRHWCDRARATGERVPLDAAFTVLRDIARALACAHEEGVVHRDVKPDNVLLSRGAAAVTDFGIATAITVSRTLEQQRGPPRSSLTGEARVIGTPGYMAPEQAAGERVDHRADLYAWGVLAWELLAGDHPFGPVPGLRRLTAQMTEDPPALSARRPDTPPAVASLIMRCLARDPAQRPQSASDILNVLESVGRESGIGRRAQQPAVLALVAAVALAIIAGTFIWRSDGDDHALDRGLIVVLPFRIAAADPAFTYLREGMLDLLAAKLTTEPRTVDQRAVLAEWRRAGGGHGDLEPARAVEVGRSLGAGRVILGDVVGTPDRVTLTASLLDAASGRERARASAVGAGGAIADLVDSLVNRLLVLDAGEGVERSLQLSSIPVEALQHFLSGQTHYRQGRYQLAGDAYARALQVDSTFALAGVMLTRTADWTFDPRDSIGRRIAREHSHRLSGRDRLMLRSPHPDSLFTTCAQRISDFERRVAAAPDLPELWYDLADRWVHCGPGMVGVQEASRRALIGFGRALALDSTFAPAVEHLAELYSIVGDTVALRLARRHAVRDTTVHFIGLRRLFLARDAEEREIAVRTITLRPHSSPAYALYLIQLLGEQTEALGTLLESWRSAAATMGEQALVQHFEYVIDMNRGRVARASRLPRRGVFSSPLLAALFWDGDSTEARRAAAAMRIGPAPGDTSALAEWSGTTFLLAQWRLAHGDTSGVAAAIGELRRLSTGHERVAIGLERLALILDAQVAAAQGRADAAQLLTSLDSMLTLSPDQFLARMVGNLVAARLWERAGETERAYAAALRYAPGPGVADLAFFSTYLREQARLAAQLGRRDEAIHHYRHYLILRHDPDPQLEEHMQLVRAELRQLESAPARAGSN